MAKIKLQQSVGSTLKSCRSTSSWRSCETRYRSDFRSVFPSLLPPIHSISSQMATEKRNALQQVEELERELDASKDQTSCVDYRHTCSLRELSLFLFSFAVRKTDCRVTNHANYHERCQAVGMSTIALFLFLNVAHCLTDTLTASTPTRRRISPRSFA